MSGLPRHKQHGMSRSRTYVIWQAMIRRCYNNKCRSFTDYGERGIHVCASWRKSFSAFIRDMGEAPDGLTLERKDNARGYSKANCKWATRAEQNRNRRGVRLFRYDGKQLTLGEISKLCGIKTASLYWRVVVKKWPLSRAVSDRAFVGRNGYA